MTLPNSLCDLEKDKYRESVSGKTCVAVCGDDGADIKADVTFLAPTGPFLITTVSVTSTAAKFPATPLTDRVSLSVRNKGAFTVYFGPAVSVTADTVVGTTSGGEIDANGELNIDLDASEDIFFITESGETAIIKITEIANT